MDRSIVDGCGLRVAGALATGNRNANAIRDGWPASRSLSVCCFWFRVSILETRDARRAVAVGVSLWPQANLQQPTAYGDQTPDWNQRQLFRDSELSVNYFSSHT